MKKRIIALIIAAMLVLCSCSSIPKEMLTAAKADAATGGTESRTYLSAKEKYDYFKALTNYLYENGKATDKQALPTIVDIDVNGENVRYTVYPKEAMTQSQCLQLAKLQTSEEARKNAFPPADEIQYDKVKGHVQKLLDEFSFDAKIANAYPLYIKAIGDDKAVWSVMVQAESGYDYAVSFYAKDGELKRIARKPVGEYNGEVAAALPKAVELSDDEVLKAAQDYYNAHALLKTDKAMLNKELVEDAKGTKAFACYKVVNYYLDKTNVNIYIDMADLSVCAVEQNI